MLQNWIWLAQHDAVSGTDKRLLLEHFSDADEIYHARSDCLAEDQEPLRPLLEKLADRDLSEAKEILAACKKADIQVLPFNDPAYPRLLRNIEDPPMVLYCLGKLPDLNNLPVVGVVGTRKASAYGLSSARQLGSQIAACGALVVSGAAFGIDSMALQGALETRSPAVGVLGCGVDIVYPKSNRQLFACLQENGCLISEYPPGTQPLKWHFPRRNRIISGISNGVLVVEAPEKSGALITARLAFDQGRDVFVVPGMINTASCAGSNALLQDRASAVFSGWDVVRDYAPLYPGKLNKQEVTLQEEPALPQPASKVAQKAAAFPVETKEKSKNVKKVIDNEENTSYSGIKDIISALSGEERVIADCLGPEACPVDTVIAKSGLPAGRALSILTTLSLKGIAVNHPGKRVSLKTK